MRIWDLRRGDVDDNRMSLPGRGLSSIVLSAALEFNYLQAALGFLTLIIGPALLVGLAPSVVRAQPSGTETVNKRSGGVNDTNAWLSGISPAGLFSAAVVAGIPWAHEPAGGVAVVPHPASTAVVARTVRAAKKLKTLCVMVPSKASGFMIPVPSAAVTGRSGRLARPPVGLRLARRTVGEGHRKRRHP